MNIATGYNHTPPPTFNSAAATAAQSITLPAAKDLFERRQQIEARAGKMWKQPLSFFKNIWGDLKASLDLRPMLNSSGAQVKSALKQQFTASLFSKGGAFQLGLDMLFTTLPTAWDKIKKGDITGAMGELGKGAVLSAGGLGAAAAVAALVPGVGIPGFILSNMAYDAGKKLTSAVTGLQQQNGSAETAPYLDPAKFPTAASLAQAEGTTQSTGAQTGGQPAQTTASAMGTSATPAKPGEISKGLQALSPESQKALAQALQQSGVSLSQLTS